MDVYVNSKQSFSCLLTSLMCFFAVFGVVGVVMVSVAFATLVHIVLGRNEEVSKQFLCFVSFFSLFHIFSFDTRVSC